METRDLLTLIAAIGTLGNSVWLIYSGFKKQKPEVKKLEIEADSELVDAANLNLEGAKISAQMLLDRINELKLELDAERTARREESKATEQARRDDAEYFRRRIKDVEREARDLRTWAAKLVKQVVEAGQIPVPYIPSFTDSDAHLQKPRPDLEAK